MKIKGIFIIFLTFITIILSNWYYNINEVRNIIDNKEITLKPEEIKYLQETNVLKESLSIKDNIVKTRTITYIKTRTKYPFIYKKDTITVTKWDYTKYN